MDHSAPPGSLVTAVMDFAMMSTAQRDRELVADLAAKRLQLCKLQMVSVGGSEFIDENGGGPGVRLKKRPQKRKS